MKLINNTTTKKPIIGKHVLDTLSIGMYNNPLMVLREYIQNSTDAIDDFCKTDKAFRSKAKITININGVNRSLSVRDDGIGIPAPKAWDVIHNLGKSTKKVFYNRGFRGIGRLGGLGYCEKLIFITKARGENKVSTSIWDCNKLRNLVVSENTSIDASAIIKNTTNFSCEKYSGDTKDHFFIVEMQNIKSSRDVLMDVPAVRSYIAQVAPVPFNKGSFSKASQIEKVLRTKVPSYETYKIYVNDEQIFKPYKDRICIGKSVTDKISDVDFIELGNGSGILAYGWVANLQLLGMIDGSENIDGMRIRIGNILIGDKDNLSEFFKERRFNSYLAGEIHIVDSRLVPNSRRDDFEDNGVKDELYDCFIKEIGIPLSRRIREMSDVRSQQRNLARYGYLVETAKKIINNGYFSTVQKKKIIDELKRIQESKKEDINIDECKTIIEGIAKSRHFLDINHKGISGKLKDTIRVIFEIIYQKCSSKQEAENTIEYIIRKVLKK